MTDCLFIAAMAFMGGVGLSYGIVTRRHVAELKLLEDRLRKAEADFAAAFDHEDAPHPTEEPSDATT